ncbi:hypothetical protein DLH72_02570 [Candidatus Gracilibacteria bacterium]|nr:MAG: hypothetical protein DLH72_02570 [Candidatus Gracilibacteria bacterium]
MQMEKNKIISIFSSIGCQNVGDELILKNEIELLKKEFGENTKFYVFTYDKKDIFVSSENIFYKEYFPIGIKNKKNIFRNIKNFFSFLNVVRKSDFVVVGGGGIIFDKENQSTKNPLDLWNFRTKIFRFFGKKIYFFRLGIDIKNEENLKKLKNIFKKYFKVVVRDKNSKNILDHIGVSSEIQKDPVFYDDGDKKFEKDFCLKKIKSYDFSVSDLRNMDFDFAGKTVGIAFRSSYLVKKSNISERMEEGKIREIINFLEKSGAKVILVPHSFHKNDPKANDYDFLKKFASDSVKILENMQEVYDIYKNKKMDLCLAMRLHSMVLAQVYEIPYVGVSYSLKTEEVLKIAFLPQS